VETKSGVKVLITESNLIDYAGMWLKAGKNNSLKAIFPGVALKENKKNDRDVAVSEYADYIAVTKGSRSFPWRILAIAETDADLVTNELSFVLGEKNVIEDPSWIKPGKVSWDWWNAMNLYGVDFKSGVNTESYKYYIDFAAKYGIEYIIMDEGWYELDDLMTLTANINMEEILSYAKQKDVGVILWVIWKTLWDQWDEAFDQFEKLDIKGIKVDFMQRDDQWMVNYYEKVAQECAKRKLLVDFHGAYKPAGLRSKYPNVITREGLRGLEQNKWCDLETPKHNVTLPFIRMVAGPMDYTPGAMVNAQKDNFKAIWNRPMSQGTRCHQLAMYVVYESPLQMLADSPSHYYDEPECMEFLSVVPAVWDTTIVLSAKIADNIAVARRNGNEWYIGAMTDKEKDITIDFSFLDDGNFNIQYYKDGINAGRYAEDFVMEKTSVTNNDKMDVHLAIGGGWAARIWKD
jgi:alpha-glucosidase